jgi:hypothetical protein
VEAAVEGSFAELAVGATAQRRNPESLRGEAANGGVTSDEGAEEIGGSRLDFTHRATQPLLAWRGRTSSATSSDLTGKTPMHF